MSNSQSRIIFDRFLRIGKNPILRSMLIVGVISLLVKAIAFYKETMVASSFGLSELLDTYYIAILIPTIIQNIFIGSLNNLFIPNYITELSTTKHKGSFQTFTLYTISLIIIALTIIALVFSEYFLEIVFSGHNEDYYALVREQLYWVLPCLFIW